MCLSYRGGRSSEADCLPALCLVLWNKRLTSPAVNKTSSWNTEKSMKFSMFKFTRTILDGFVSGTFDLHRPQTKLWEGNLFTPVCHFVRGVVQTPLWDNPRDQIPPPIPDQTSNLSVQMSKPKVDLPRWKSTHPDYYSTYIYILILNNSIKCFNSLLLIILNINPGGKMLNFFENFN